MDRRPSSRWRANTPHYWDCNKALAQEAHDRFKSELWRIGHLGDKSRHTWNDAVVRWFKEQSHNATAGEDVSKLRWLYRHLVPRT